MAAINDLIAQIEDIALRERIAKEVDRLSKQKKFGLVFEEHLPECTPLYDIPVKVGALVAKKAGEVNDVYKVLCIEDNAAQCLHRESKEIADIPLNDLVTVAEFGEPIYPYLKPIDTVCNAPDSDLWHTLIEADNYHALQLLEYLYAGKVDCIYIDPPYNTGAKDWKYNNDYVDGSDAYRHSKWLSFIQRRLKLARKLLNPADSVLIVTIDEKEYLHLGCLLEEMFPEARMQMITTVISAKGVVRTGQLSRVEEYIFILEWGSSCVQPSIYNMLDDEVKKESDRFIEWLGFRRRAPQAKRNSRPNQFYPIYVSNVDGKIVSIGDVVKHGVDRNSIFVPDGCTALWPLSKDGDERLWSLVPEQARLNFEKGYLKVNNWKVVVNAMLSNAKSSILITGYSLSDYFSDLVDCVIRKSQEGVLVKFFVNDIDSQKSFDRLCRYKGRFLRIYNYPKQEDKMSALHAKVISVDQQDTLITSANLSYHGQEGNIELGTKIHSRDLARQVEDVFTKLVFKKAFVEL